MTLGSQVCSVQCCIPQWPPQRSFQPYSPLLLEFTWHFKLLYDKVLQQFLVQSGLITSRDVRKQYLLSWGGILKFESHFSYLLLQYTAVQIFSNINTWNFSYHISNKVCNFFFGWLFLLEFRVLTHFCQKCPFCLVAAFAQVCSLTQDLLKKIKVLRCIFNLILFNQLN